MSTRESLKAAPALLGAALALALAAGCDSSTKGSGGPADPGSGSSTASGSLTASTRSTPSTSSATRTFGTATPSSPPPQAADGTNVRACADGRCEITVRAGTAIPVPKSMDVEKLTVSKVSRSRVTVTGHVLGNASGGGCTGICDASSSNGTFKIALGADSLATENGLALAVEYIGDGTAIVKITPA